MPLVTYVFQRDCGANKAGDVVSLDQDEAQTLVEAGLIQEATQDDVSGGDVVTEGEEEGADQMAVTRAIEDGFKKLQSTLVQNVTKTQKSAPDMKIPAQTKQPIFKSLGELVRSNYRAKNGDYTSMNKLRAWQTEMRQKTTPAGANEGTSSQGGYAVIPEWTNEIFSKVKNLPKLLDMTDRQTISGNTLNIPAINETSLVDGSRGGGIRRYWVTEGDTATTSYPQLTQVQAVLNTAVVLVPITNQLLEDNAYNLDKFIAEKVGEEFVWGEMYDVISGSGSGQPKGILNQAALVTITKESGQTAGTVNFQNIIKMWNRLYPGSRANALWLANPQVFAQLVQMTFPNASGTYPAFGGVMSFNAHDEFPLRIWGKPVLECLSSPATGLVGDLILADLKALTTAEHPGMQVAVSDQVYFTSLQTLFRFVRRYDIQSPWTAALTPYDGGSQTYSPFIALQSRGT